MKETLLTSLFLFLFFSSLSLVFEWITAIKITKVKFVEINAEGNWKRMRSTGWGLLI